MFLEASSISNELNTDNNNLTETSRNLVDGFVYVQTPFISDIRGPESPPGSGLYPPDGVVDGWDYNFIGLYFGKTSLDPEWPICYIADTRGPESPPGSGLYPPDGVVDGWDYNYAGLEFGSSIW